MIVAEATRRLDAELAEITDFAVTAASNTGAIRKWLAANGLQTDSVAKDVLETLLARDDLTQEQRRVLEIRRDGGKSSTAKIDAMLARRQADGRMRGNLQYHGAGTGRWAARGAQLQNLMRPTESASAVSQIIDMILEGHRWIDGDDRMRESTRPGMVRPICPMAPRRMPGVDPALKPLWRNTGCRGAVYLTAADAVHGGVVSSSLKGAADLVARRTKVQGMVAAQMPDWWS